METTAEDGCHARLMSLGEVKDFAKNTLDLWPRFPGRILAWDVNGDWVVTQRYKLGKLVDDHALPAGKHWPWLAMEYIDY